MLQLKRIDNLDIVVRGYDAMVDFYRDVLGFEYAPNGYVPEKGWAMFECHNIHVVLLSAPDSGTPRHRTPEYWTNPAGMDSLAFEVDDIDEAIAALDQAGVRWAGDLVIEGNGELLDAVPAGAFDGTWYRFRSFYDPEGNLLHVTEPHRPGSP